jgi:hypothetical protein
MTTQNAATRTTTRRRDARELGLEMAIDNGREVITNAARLLRCFAEEMERYATRYDDCGNDSSVKHETVLGWAVNHVANLQSNLRLDLFVNRAGEIAERRTELASAGANDEA